MVRKIPWWLPLLRPERDLGDLPLLGPVEVEVHALPELEEAGHEVGGKYLDRRVEVPHHGVEVAPRALDGVLDLPQRGLERLEVGARLEVGIGLGEREEAAQGLGQLAFRLSARLGRLRG